MKHSFTGGILLALPLSLLAFTACGDESIVKTNDIKQISEDDSLSSSSESSSSSLAKSSSSSSKSSKKFSLSSKAEEVSVEDDDVESKGDLPRCTISREGVEVYVKEEKKLYTCEEGKWIPEEKAAESSSSSSNSKKYSSSSKLIIAPLSSSSVIYIDVDFSSSSEKGGPVAMTGLGKCAPAKTPISKGETVTWRFSANTQGTYGPMDFVKATYVWDLGGLLDDGSQISTTSGKVTYTSSGVYNASVKVAMEDGGFEDIQCEPLQVNGDPITGCKCTASETSVDYTTTPDVTWTVSGCTSASEINSYVWNGVAGAETYTKRFDEAQSGYAPTLKVGNDDNTVVDVICDAVKTTMGAEFLFEKQNTKIALPAGASNVVFDLPSTWHGYGSTDGNCTFSCGGANQPVTITIGMESSKPDYFATISIPVAWTINKTMVTVTLDAAADCQVSF